MDEEALSALPEILKDNMEDLQKSRIEKWHKIQEKIGISYSWRKKARCEGNVALGPIESNSPTAVRRANDDETEAVRSENTRLRRSRSASAIYGPNTGRSPNLDSRRPRTADVATRPNPKSVEQMLCTSHSASAFRERALFSNAPTADERHDATVLSEDLGLTCSTSSLTLSLRNQRNMDPVSAKKPGLMHRLKRLKHLSLHALYSRKSVPKRSQEHHERPTKLQKPALKQRGESSSIRHPGLDGGACSYRAQLEGYDI